MIKPWAALFEPLKAYTFVKIRQLKKSSDFETAEFLCFCKASAWKSTYNPQVCPAKRRYLSRLK